MKYLKVLLSIAVVLSLMACGGGNKTATDIGSGSGVALFTSAPATMSIPSGTTATTFSIGGGKSPYAVATSNATVAAISLTTTASFGIAAGIAGTAQVVITDSAGAKVTVDVTVTVPTPPALFTSAPSAITVPSGLSSPAIYKISGGVLPYTAASSNPNVALATVTGGNSLIVYGDRIGAATVDVVDVANSKVSIAVTVSASSTAPTVLNVLPSGASGTVGDTLTFTLYGGTPAYTIVVTNPSIATVSATSLPNAGSQLTASLKSVGDTVITVSDTLGQTTTFTVTVGAATSQLRLLPSALIVGENYGGTISLGISGGTPPYRALSSHLPTTSAQIGNTGNTLDAGTGTNTSRCIDPRDDSGTYIPFGTLDVTLTVLDATGLSATSILSIKDNGLGLATGCP